MQVPFRQGIVKAIPNFLQLTGSTVSLVIPQPAYVLVTIADGTSDYLISENASVSNAWTGPFSSGVDYWLFWELHPITGAKMYGHTLYEPIESTIAPTSPVNDQHWFDSTAGKMKVWNGTASRWVEKIRVFAARLTSATQIVSMSINSPSFEGTQVGSYLSTQVLAGYIVLDNEGKALRKGNGKFFTTEEVGVSGVTHASRVKFSSIVREAEAAANMANLTVVAFTDFDTIVPATPSMVTQGKLFGIIEEDVIIGGFVNVVFEGVVSSSDWDWTSLGVNAPLYIGAGGVLSATATPPALTPIAVVSGIHSIQFGVPKVVTVGGSIVDVMSTTVQGTGKLSVVATNPADPVVVGDNDPRLTDARTPLAHAHAIADVTGLQGALDGKLSLTGGTLSGTLTLSADPTLALEAATKQYVDAAGGGGAAVAIGQVAYGTGTSVTGSPLFTYSPTTGDLMLSFGVSTTTTGDVTIIAQETTGVGEGWEYGGGNVTINGGNSPEAESGSVWLQSGSITGIGHTNMWPATLVVAGRGVTTSRDEIATIKQYTEKVTHISGDAGDPSLNSADQHLLYATTLDSITPQTMRYGANTLRKFIPDNNTITQFQLDVVGYTASTDDTFVTSIQGAIKMQGGEPVLVGTLLRTVVVQTHVSYQVNIAANLEVGVEILVQGSGPTDALTNWSGTLRTNVVHYEWMPPG